MAIRWKMPTKRLPPSINYRPVDLIFFFVLLQWNCNFFRHSTSDFAIESGISISRFQNSCIVKLSAKIRLIKKITQKSVSCLFVHFICSVANFFNFTKKHKKLVTLIVSLQFFDISSSLSVFWVLYKKSILFTHHFYFKVC